MNNGRGLGFESVTTCVLYMISRKLQRIASLLDVLCVRFRLDSKYT